MLGRITSWTAVVFAVLIGLIAFVGALLMLRAVSEDLWSEEAAGWAQAIGSVVAIGIAFHTGSRQGRDAINAIEHGFNLTERRKYAAFSVIAEAAKRHAAQCETVFHEDGFSYTTYLCTELDGERQNLIRAIDAIPVHEVGSYEAVSALVALKAGITDLDIAVTRATVYIEGIASTIDYDWQRLDTSAIRGCAESVQYRSDALIDAMMIKPSPTGPA